MISVSFKSNKILRYLVHIPHTLLLSVFSLCNAVGFIFIKVLGFARDPSISDFAWCFAVI